MKNVLPAATAVMMLLFCSCGGGKEDKYDPLPGDILFMLSGTSEMSEAISSATERDSKDSSGQDSETPDDSSRQEEKSCTGNDDFDHVGIFAVIEGQQVVIEATPKKGVVATPLEEFIRDARENSGGFVVKRLKTEVDIDDCVRRAEGMLGLPYDWSFLPDNGKIYCSELVYESFMDSSGRHVFTATPMNFRDSEGNLPTFWSALFSSLGEPVPEGVPGTNPNDLARESCLIEAYRSK